MGILENPRQTALVTSKAVVDVMGKSTEKEGAITIDWHMPVSFEPKLYAISIGKTRFSLKLIQESKAFVVNLMPFEKAKEVLFCGRHSGEMIDKIKDAGLETEDSTSIDCPRIKEAVGYIECEVVKEIEAGDHIIFVGKIVHSELKDELAKRLFHISGDDFTTTK